MLLASAAHANDEKEGGDKLLSGMSIVGDDEAPKSLVIVPWKASTLADRIDVSKILDETRRIARLVEKTKTEQEAMEQGGRG